MPLLREKFDVRPITHGITPHGESHIVSNQIGKHVYHTGETVDLHCHESTIHVKIIGQINDHLIGQICSFNKHENKFENI